MSVRKRQPIVGEEVEARCGKCKLDTVHIITTVEGEKIKRVMCKICLSYHAYKAAGGDTQQTAPSKTRRKGSTRSRKKDWGSLVAELDDTTLPVYRITDDYSTSKGIRHPKFGVGVTTNVFDNKIEVLFKDGVRLLVHNWREI